MNRLNKIILSFVLPFFCLLISVSYADIVANQSYAGNNAETETSVTFTDTYVEGYTYILVNQILTNYVSDSTNETYINDFNNMISAFENSGKNVVVFKTMYDSKNYACIVTYDSDSNVCFGSPLDRIGFILNDTSQTKTFSLFCNRQYKYYNITCTPERPFPIFNTYQCYEVYYASTDIYQLTMSGSWLFSWDGTSYYYKAPVKPEPDSPSLPSNQEIASAVQAFYNSDYYKNNKDFEDFLVLYNTKTGYFSFVGHNFGNKLGQQIIDPDVSVGSPPVSYNQRWWHFYLAGLSEFTSTLFNKYYWLYGTSDFGENFEYQGKGSINDLLDVHFATASTIIYSTTDYPVTIVTADGTQTDIIPGDQYTYDENVDPTTNEYNPLENFVPTSPSQSILGDVDFNEINKVFEENKDILNIENASWLFSANNQLVSYFLGFLLLLIVFLIISRVLGG